MANFEIARKLTHTHETGYSNHPDDVGRETWNGIARYYHNDWSGWKILDGYANKEHISKSDLARLKMLEVAFYRAEFWRKIKGDQLPDQELANWLYDIAVNASPKRAGRYLQRALNLCNRQERDYDDLDDDGVIARNTLSALRKFLSKRDKHTLLLFVGCQMVTHWMHRAKKISSQEQFINGIGNRWVANVKSVADQYYLT